MDLIVRVFKKYQMLILGGLFIYFAQRVIYHPVFISSKYQRQIDLRPFEWPFGLFLFLIGLMMIYAWYKQNTHSD